MSTQESNGTLEASNQAEVAPVETGQFVTFGTALIISLMSVVLTLCCVYLLANAKYDIFGVRKENVPKIASLDFDKLLEAGVNNAVSNSASSGNSDYRASAEEFNRKVDAIIKDMTDKGYIIINQKALVNNSKFSDITQEVIDRVLINKLAASEGKK